MDTLLCIDSNGCYNMKKRCAYTKNINNKMYDRSRMRDLSNQVYDRNINDFGISKFGFFHPNVQHNIHIRIWHTIMSFW